MNTTTNTKGVIAEASEKITGKKQATPAQILNGLLNNNAIQEQLKSTLKENAGAFVTSVMNVFRDDKLLQTCDPKAVLSEALKAAALKLPIEKQLGFGYIIAFNDHKVPKPQFILGYKGYIQLAERTGTYRYINTGAVYEGEFKSLDKLTGALDISGEKTSDEIIGYFAYIETISGFKKAMYWTKEQVRKHAGRYSKSFQKNSAIWRDNFDEMAIKTVLRNLLSHYGVISVEMENAITEEIRADEPPANAPEIEVEAETAKPSEITAGKIEAAAEGIASFEPITESAQPSASNNPAPDDYPF